MTASEKNILVTDKHILPSKLIVHSMKNKVHRELAGFVNQKIKICTILDKNYVATPHSLCVIESK